MQTDDFKITSGVIEGTSAVFGNTWKTRANCPNVENTFEDPCTVSIQNGKLTIKKPFLFSSKMERRKKLINHQALSQNNSGPFTRTLFSSTDTRSF